MRFLKNPRTRNDKRETGEKLDEILTMLKDMRKDMADMYERVELIEKVLGDRLPPDILTERKFAEEVQGGDEIVERIISKVEELNMAKSIKNIIEDRLDQKISSVETRRIESITGLLQHHGKLSSAELSRHIGLSRTRSNEYFKQMEILGIVEPVEIGKQKFYRLSS